MNMKRSIAFLLVLVLLTGALAGCERFVEAGEGSRPLLPPVTELTEGTGPTEAGEEKDPTVDEYGFTLFPEGDYLADPIFDTEEYLPEYDADPSFVHTLSTTYPLCSNETTIYSIATGGNRMVFTDKATGISLPLCGKPECLHNDESCNAYVASNAGYISGLCVYDGSICWYDMSSRKVYRMDPDGTKRETICETPQDFMRMESGVTNPCAVIHRGYLYVGYNTKEIVDGVPMSCGCVVAQPLDGGEAFTLLERRLEKGFINTLIKPAGNDVYIFINAYQESEGGETCLLEAYRWSSVTREGERLCVSSDKAEEEYYSDKSHGVIPGKGLYFSSSGWATSEGDAKTSTTTVNRCSLETGETEKLVRFVNGDGVSYGGEAYFTREHIIVPVFIRSEGGEGEYRVRLYDYGGELVTELDMKGLNFSVFLGEDEEYLYGYLSKPDQGEAYFAVPLDGGEPIMIDE